MRINLISASAIPPPSGIVHSSEINRERPLLQLSLLRTHARRKSLAENADDGVQLASA